MEKFKKIPPVGWMLLVMILIFSMFSEHYFSLSNFVNVLLQASPLMILALGQTLVILSEGIDMSLGAQVSFATVFWVFSYGSGMPLGLGAILTVVLLTVIGGINGFFVGKFNMPPFIVTLAMMNILNSISLQIPSASIYNYSPIFTFISSGSLLFIPIPLLLVFVMFLLSWKVLHNTRFGSTIRGLGGNKESLSVAGINITKVQVKVYAFAGFLAGVCGLLTTCRVESGQPIVASGWEFDAVAATLLGGTSFYDGRGDLSGTIFGVLLIKILQNGLNVSGVNTMYHNAIIGFVVLVAIVVDALLKREQNRYQEIR